MTRRLADFSLSPQGIPLSEVSEFYSLQNVSIPDSRPFVWSMSVSSLDGRLGYGDGTLPSSIALAHGPPDALSGASADWRLLQAGWAASDAVLISGSCLRSEPETTLRVTQEDLINGLRVDQGKSRQPMRVILTGSGNIDPGHLIFKRHEMDDDGGGGRSITLVATTSVGSETFKSNLEDLGFSVSPLDDPKLKEEGVEVYNVFKIRDNQGAVDKSARIKIVVAQEEGGLSVSYEKLLRYIRSIEGVSFLDVSAGGVVIGGMMAVKVIDEVRLTLAGNLVGDGPNLPNLVSFPRDFEASPATSPLVRYDSVRSLGPHHLFIRSSVIYRH